MGRTGKIEPIWKCSQPCFDAHPVGAARRREVEMAKPLERSALDPRVGIRSNVFLNAAMLAGGKPTHVRVQNISETDALLDGSCLPPEGSPVQLRRGSLVANGEIAWQTRGQCGLHFEAPVDVPAWVRRVGQASQDRVDRLIHFARGNAFPGVGGAVEKQAEDTLDRVWVDLADTCDRLADLTFSVEQSEEFLKLDVIVQRLKKLVEKRLQRDDISLH